VNSNHRIFLGDLCYLHEWDVNQPVPLNVGYIAAYLQKHSPEVSIEIFKDPLKMVRRCKDSPPNVIALSYYDWNANLDIAVLRSAKQASPNLISVLGGPNFEADDLDWVEKFFLARPDVDLFITGEGEWSFNKFIQLLEEYGAVNEFPYKELPSTFFQLDRKTGEVIHNPNNHVDRLDLSTVPSPYLTGLMDPFLDDAQLAPIFETNRGCPYSCTFCCWGQATQSKVNRFPLETVKAEIRYAIERTKNNSGFVYIADGNFGILPRDVEIAGDLQQCSELYDTPKHVYIYFAKNTNDRVIKVAETLKAISSMSMSKQTLNHDVLQNIRRKNIPVEQYDALRIECEKREIDTFCELIYGLPGESYRSFVDGVIKTVRDGQQAILYPYIMLHGAENSDRIYRSNYGIKTAFRIIPRYICSSEGLNSLEYEEVVISTNAMPFADYLRVRLFQILCLILGREMFTEFARGLECVGLDYATLADFVTRDDENWTPLFGELMRDHMAAVEDELIFEDQLKLEFTVDDVANASDRNVLTLPKLVSSAALVDDFHRYLDGIISGHYSAILTNAEMTEVTQALQFSIDKIVCFDSLEPTKIVEYEYDIDAWQMSDRLLPLEQFRSEAPIRYLFSSDKDVLTQVEQAKAVLGDVAQAVYRVRINLIRGLGDRAFCYKRVPWSDAVNTETHAEHQQRRSDMNIRSEVTVR